MSGVGTGAARVEALLDLGRHAEARDLVGPLIAERPDDPRLHALLCDALAGLEEHRAALDAADRVVGLAPLSAAGHRRRAACCHRLGWHDHALPAALEAVRLGPGWWWHHAQLAQVAAARRSTLPLAWDAARHAVHLAPEVAGAHFSVGYVAECRGDATTAARAYRRALAIDPSYATAMHNLSLVDGPSDLDRIARGVAGALALDPQHPGFRRTLDRYTWRSVMVVWTCAVALVWLAPPLVPAAAPGSYSGPAVVLAAIGALVGWWTAVVRRLPLGVRRHVASHLRSRPGLIALLTTSALAGVGAVLAASPGTEDQRFAISAGAVGLQLLALLAALAERGARAEGG